MINQREEYSRQNGKGLAFLGFGFLTEPLLMSSIVSPREEVTLLGPLLDPRVVVGTSGSTTLYAPLEDTLAILEASCFLLLWGMGVASSSPLAFSSASSISLSL